MRPTKNPCKSDSVFQKAVVTLVDLSEHIWDYRVGREILDQFGGAQRVQIASEELHRGASWSHS